MGPDFKYALRQPVSIFRTFPISRSTGHKLNIFLIGYWGTYVSGEPKLSEEHSSFKWLEIDEIEPQGMFSGGFLDGFNQFRSFFLRRFSST